MIDTVGIFVPIASETFDYLAEKSVMTQRIDQSYFDAETGEDGAVEFEYHNFNVHVKSWNYKVAFRLDDRQWLYDPLTKQTQLSRGIPHLRFEFSVPKILYGHNVDSAGVGSIIPACEIVHRRFEEEFGVTIPYVYKWYCYRIDTCANFILPSLEVVKRLLCYLKKFEYPRKPSSLYTTGMYFATRRHTLKIYAKGPEFAKHDAVRISNEIEKQKIKKVADCILRVEVEHKEKLKALAVQVEAMYGYQEKFNGYMRLVETFKYFNCADEMRCHMDKMLLGTATKVMKTADVFELLLSKLGSRSAHFYASIYMMLVTHGQSFTKERTSESTYYKALALFRELGVSILVSDLEKIDIALDRGFPEDFSFELSAANRFYQLPKAA